MAAAAAMTRSACALLRSTSAPGAASGALRSAWGPLQAQGRGPLTSPAAWGRRFSSQNLSAREKAIRLAEQIGKVTEKHEDGGKVKALVNDLVAILKTSEEEISVEELGQKVKALSERIDAVSQKQLIQEIAFKMYKNAGITISSVFAAALIALPSGWYMLKVDLDHVKVDVKEKFKQAISSVENLKKKMKGKENSLKQVSRAAESKEVTQESSSTAHDK